MENYPADKDILARSFEIALKQYVSGEGPAADTPDMRGRLAGRIMALAALGEQSEQRLASQAILYLRAFSAAMRISAVSPFNEPAASHSIAAGPDMITAMTQALNDCLEDLPEGGISSTVRSILQKAILEAAGNGVHDPNEMKSFALEQLRNRA